MKQGSTFLKIVIILIAILAFVGLLRFPLLEGRATNLDLISIYADPFIIYLYAASLPFFIALYQAFKILGYIEGNKVFSQPAVNAVKKIKYCAIAIPILIATAEAVIILNASGDDKAGPVALGIYSIFISIVIATALAILQKLLQNAVDMKSENDLTV